MQLKSLRKPMTKQTLSRHSTQRVSLTGGAVSYRVIRSDSARKIRIRIGPQGMEVIHPKVRSTADVKTFLRTNEQWILNQLTRVRSLHGFRKRKSDVDDQILLKGMPMRIIVSDSLHRKGTSKVIAKNGMLLVIKGTGSKTPVAKTLEYWLRRQARAEISKHLEII